MAIASDMAIGNGMAIALPGDILDDPRILWTDALLRFADMDAYGHVSNRAFSEIFESGRMAFITKHIESRVSADFFVAIARLTIDFWNEFSFPEPARTGTWVSRVGRSSVTLDQVIMGRNGVVGTASGVCVLVERASRRSAAMPDHLRRALIEACAGNHVERIAADIARSKNRAAEPAVATPSP